VDKPCTAKAPHFVHRVPTGCPAVASRVIGIASTDARSRKRRSAQAWAVLEIIIIEKINKILIKRTHPETSR
jgi:hypothetical protein